MFACARALGGRVWYVTNDGGRGLCTCSLSWLSRLVKAPHSDSELCCDAKPPCAESVKARSTLLMLSAKG